MPYYMEVVRVAFDLDKHNNCESLGRRLSGLEAIFIMEGRVHCCLQYVLFDHHLLSLYHVSNHQQTLQMVLATVYIRIVHHCHSESSPLTSTQHLTSAYKDFKGIWKFSCQSKLFYSFVLKKTTILNAFFKKSMKHMNVSSWFIMRFSMINDNINTWSWQHLFELNPFCSSFKALLNSNHSLSHTFEILQ